MSMDNEVPPEVISFFRSSYCVIDSVQDVRSAQHLMLMATVRVLPFPPSVSSLSVDDVEALNFRQKIIQQQLQDSDDNGCVRIMLRVWKGSGSWWNFNRSSTSSCDIATLAIREVSAYLAARQILLLVDNDASSGVTVPQLLHFSHSNDRLSQKALLDNIDNDHNSTYWAALSYHGESSFYFQQRNQQRQKYHDRGSFTNQMITVREEFGFSEPHPRHGRVSVDKALPYALKILDHVVLPIHMYLFRRHFWFPKDQATREDVLSPLIRKLSCKDGKPYCYKKMLQKYKEIYQILSLSREMKVGNNSVNPEGWEDNRRLQQIVGTLHLCIQQLEQEYVGWESSFTSQLPPVLCHCDLQPQNIIFWTEDPITDDDPSDNRLLRNDIPNVACVLDWEEAAWADPRFELILLCRKICANMDQATAVWLHYTSSIQQWGAIHDVQHMIKIGPMDPWLKLEAVHSLTIFLLQTINLSGRGAQWERNQDLLSKMERELSRLSILGWSFCTNSTCSADK